MIRQPRIVAKTALFVFILASVCLGSTARPVADEYSFVTLQLPYGIGIDVPRSWWILDEQMNQLIATSRDAALDLSGLGIRYTGDTLFAANSMPPTTYASVRVSIDHAEASTPDDLTDLENLGAFDLQILALLMEEGLNRTLAAADLRILETLGVSKERYASHPAVSFKYRRSSPHGPVIVDLIQIWRQDAMVRINLAYRESEGQLWKVVIARMKRSIVIQ